MRTINLIGKKFGKLEVVGLSEKRGNRKQIKWNCICDCGNAHIVTGESLREGKSKSCGCLQKELKAHNYNKNRPEAILKIQYFHLKRRHNKKTKEPVISFKEFQKLSYQKCFYCGLESSKIIEDRYNDSKSKNKISNTTIKINGIDRVNSNTGYTQNNVVACCLFCNRAKMDMTKQDFMSWVKRIYEYNF